MKNITEYVMKLWHVMKHSFAPNPDLEICPPLRRSQNCRWGRQTQPGKSVAINKEQRAYSDPSLYTVDCMHAKNYAKESLLQMSIKCFCQCMKWWEVYHSFITKVKGERNYHRGISLTRQTRDIQVQTNFPKAKKGLEWVEFLEPA